MRLGNCKCHNQVHIQYPAFPTICLKQNRIYSDVQSMQWRVGGEFEVLECSQSEGYAGEWQEQVGEDLSLGDCRKGDRNMQFEGDNEA
uniref:Pentatricopeptide repeat-containing protein n=1 Tax=Solanum tuberosum TaxID=4113 RepID=M0ZN78_SOLTU